MRSLFIIFISVLLPVIFLSITRVLAVYESDYTDDSIIDLPLAEKDALNVYSFFKNLPNAQAELLENPTLGNFISSFKRWVRSSSEGDTLIFYYSGHGITEGDEFYFIPSDADPEDEFTWVSFSRLKRYVPERTKLVWLIDACYSGSIVKGRPLRGARIRKEVLKLSNYEVVITSSENDEISKELPSGEGGIFTHAVIEGLKGGADENKDGWITVKETNTCTKRWKDSAGVHSIHR